MARPIHCRRINRAIKLSNCMCILILIECIVVKDVGVGALAIVPFLLV